MKKKVKKNAYNISSLKRVTRKFLEGSGCTCAKQWQRNVPKKCAATCRIAFWLIRPIVVFSPFSLPSPLKVMLHRTMFATTILSTLHSVTTLLYHCFEGCNIVPTFEPCVVLKIVAANCFL